MINTVGARFRLATCLLVFSLLALLALPLAASAHEESVFASIRLYDGIEPTDLAEADRITRQGFLPLISESDGFIAYYVVHPQDGQLAAINVFESREQALASNELAREFVVEKLAPLLPNPPRIVEGSVDLAFVEMLDGMAHGDVNSLHASLRVYDGFAAADLAQFVSIVEDGFLPIMRETDGFFGYYLMHDDAGALAAFSIFASEASALASNEKARDFVAENLTAYLPNDPTVVAGRVAVAVLADHRDGANLINDAAFASLRVYEGVDPADQAEIARLTTAGFLPIMRASAGFVGYYFLPAEDKLATVSLFNSPEQASASNDKARAFVAAELAPLLPNPPTAFEGRLAIDYLAAPIPSEALADVGQLFASIRFYQGFDLSHFDEANELAIAHLLPALQELGGFFALFALNDGEDTVVGISVFESEEAALAANETGKAFTREYLAEWAPNPPTGVTGQLAIAALAEINMGENLAGA
ncbi:MAG: hypothetical protein OXG85_04465 [Chloroflexi bacterium]|nr:hypothetical protein [Chloroflexota bacterium]